MQNVLILGASGQIAQFVEKEIKDNVNLTLFLRHPEKLEHQYDNVIVGDVINPDDLNKAMEGQDIVYANLGPSHMVEMANSVVAAANHNDVKRLIWVATVGIYEEYDPSHKASVEAAYGSIDDPNSYMGDERRGADIVDNSLLDTTVIRPNTLTNDDEISDIEITERNQQVNGDPISRKTVGHFISQLILSPDNYINGSIGLAKKK